MKPDFSSESDRLPEAESGTNPAQKSYEDILKGVVASMNGPDGPEKPKCLRVRILLRSVTKTIPTAQGKLSPKYERTDPEDLKPQVIAYNADALLCKTADGTVLLNYIEPSETGMVDVVTHLRYSLSKPNVIEFCRGGSVLFNLYIDTKMPRQTLHYQTPYGVIKAAFWLLSVENKLGAGHTGSVKFTYRLDLDGHYTQETSFSIHIKPMQKQELRSDVGEAKHLRNESWMGMFWAAICQIYGWDAVKNGEASPRNFAITMPETY